MKSDGKNNNGKDMKRILIVGAGIAGLGMYRSLLGTAFQVDIVERASQWAEGGAGICLPANAVAGMERLGLKGALMAQAYQVKNVTYADNLGRPLSSASLLESPLDVQPFVALPRAALLKILRQGLDGAVQFGKWPDAIQSIGSRTRVQFNDGDITDYDLIIAADGIHSNVRQIIFSDAGTQDLGVTCWRFLHDKPNHGRQPIYMVGAHDAFMFYPLSDDLLYCYAQVGDKSGALLTGSAQEHLRKHFSSYCLPVRDAINQASQHSMVAGRLESVRSRQVYRGRVVLIGDALHGCPPTLQQGVAMALEDIFCLTDYLESGDIDQALAKFKQTRLSRVQWVIEQSNKIIKLAGIGKTAPGRWLRNRMIRKQGPANVNGWRKLLLEAAAP